MTDLEATRQYLRDRLAVERNMKLSDLLAPDAFASAPRVWIVGGGPSVRNFDWEKLRGEVVIGVNRAYELPHVGMTVSMDCRYKKWVVNGDLGADSLARWRSFEGPKVFTVLPNTPLSYYGDETFYCVDRHDRKYVYPPTLDLLGFGNNSGWMALQLAWALGAPAINLLGFDMKGSDSKQAWWHGGYPKQTDDSCYDRFREPFEKAAPELVGRCGVSVINFCWDSGLKCFPRGDDWALDLLLSYKLERPLVVGYYTLGTPYEQEIKGMVQSARAHGLEVYTEGVADQGGWTKNTYYKAEFIDRMLDRFPDQPLLFLDADSRIRRYPALFNGFKADFGACIFDWIRWKPDRADRELSSAVLYLRNTPAVRHVIREWMRLNETRPKAPCQDQRNLGDAVAAMRQTGELSFAELPPAYCQIFDSMAFLGQPVIEQMQASRRYKREVGA